MAFKLAQNPTFKTKIIVHVPNDKCGFDKSFFIAEFKRPVSSIFESVQESEVTAADYMRTELVGWEEMYTDDQMKDEVAFTEENVAALFEIPEAVNALIDQYREAIKVAREKNFKR